MYSRVVAYALKLSHLWAADWLIAAYIMDDVDLSELEHVSYRGQPTRNPRPLNTEKSVLLTVKGGHGGRALIHMSSGSCSGIKGFAPVRESMRSAAARRLCR